MYRAFPSCFGIKPSRVFPLFSCLLTIVPSGCCGKLPFEVRINDGDLSAFSQNLEVLPLPPAQDSLTSHLPDPVLLHTCRFTTKDLRPRGAISCCQHGDQPLNRGLIEALAPLKHLSNPVTSSLQYQTPMAT